MKDEKHPEDVNVNNDERFTPEARALRVVQNLEENIVEALQLALSEGKLDHANITPSERSALVEGKCGQLSLRRLLDVLCHLPAFEIMVQNTATSTLVTFAPFITSHLPFPRKKHAHRRPIQLQSG